MTTIGRTPRVGDLDITRAPQVEVIGLGTEETAIESGFFPIIPASDRVFDVDAGASLRLAALTVKNGLATSGWKYHGHGGGIHNHGTLVLDSVTIASSEAVPGWGGGGLTNAPSGTATPTNVTVVNNSAQGMIVGSGGGIENGGNLTLSNVTIGWNDVLGPGGLPPAGLPGAGLLPARRRSTTRSWRTTSGRRTARRAWPAGSSRPATT